MKKKKLRATLTILGVLIGVAAIISINSLGSGFQATFTAQFEKSLGINTLRVTTTSFGPGGGETYDTQLLYNDTFNLEKIDGVSLVTAIKQTTGVMYTTDNYTSSVSIIGTDIDKYKEIFDTFKIAEGELPAELENNTAIVGYGIQHPYGNDTVVVHVGDLINISITYRTNNGLTSKNFTFKVAATLKQAGGFSQEDGSIFVPISTIMDILNTTEVNYIIVQVEDTSKIDSVKQQILNYYNGKVNVISSEAMIQSFQNMFGTMVLFLTAIGFISLVVAGVGIMNIMTVAVTERTREIGILKAIGARNRTVMVIFLTEAVIIGIVGGVLGVIVGYFGASILGTRLISMLFNAGSSDFSRSNFTIQISPLLDPATLLMSLGLAVGLSILFALQPAYNASRKNPVEALRYE